MGCYTAHRMNPPYSLYIHIPFCRRRCGYCDFNTYAGLETWIEPYAAALQREIELLAQSAGQRLAVHTIYFGGGTPSLLPLPLLADLLQTLAIQFDWQTELEISLEANPGTLSPAYLQGLHSLGVNRLSLGVQSAHPNELHLLERLHTYEDVIQAVSQARQARFDNLSLDLIYALPGQSLEGWQRTLQLVTGLQPEHLSLYPLTIEPETPFGRWVRRGLLMPPDPDLAADMYEWSTDFLDGQRYQAYEISNWARVMPQGSLMSCRHNLQYWRNQPYLGLGAGAHGYAGGLRTANLLSPVEYIRRCQTGAPLAFPRTPATHEVVCIDRPAEIGETMMMGLRLLLEGVPQQVFQERFGVDLPTQFKTEIDELLRLGLLEWAPLPTSPDPAAPASGLTLRLTRRGRLLGNQVFMRFI